MPGCLALVLQLLGLADSRSDLQIASGQSCQVVAAEVPDTGVLVGALKGHLTVNERADARLGLQTPLAAAERIVRAIR